jgi:hypothetical protein
VEEDHLHEHEWNHATSKQLDHVSASNLRWNFNDVGGGVFLVDRFLFPLSAAAP